MNCKWSTPKGPCGQPTAKGSKKYCATHKPLARAAWKEMIAKQKSDREEWQEKMFALFKEATEAGVKAGQNALPTPMVVQERVSPLDDTSPVKKEWFVSEGVCGFAWVKILPGNCKAANFAKKYYQASKAYGGGVSIWMHNFGQSYERKMAAARAMSAVLREGLEELDPKASVYAGGRLD